MSRYYGFVRDSGKQKTREVYAEMNKNYEKIRAKAYNTYNYCLNKFLTTQKFEVQRYRGDAIYSPTIHMMTPHEWGIENKKSEASFWKKLDKDPNTRLWRWRLVDLKGYVEAKDRYIDKNRTKRDPVEL